MAFGNNYKASYRVDKHRSKPDIPGTSVFAMDSNAVPGTFVLALDKPGPKASVHRWNKPMHSSLVFHVGKDDTLSIKKTELPGTSTIKVGPRKHRDPVDRQPKEPIRQGEEQAKEETTLAIDVKPYTNHDAGRSMKFRLNANTKHDHLLPGTSVLYPRHSVEKSTVQAPGVGLKLELGSSKLWQVFTVNDDDSTNNNNDNNNDN